MAKLKNNLFNMVASLTVITVIVGGLLGYVNSVTMEPIKQTAENNENAAVFEVVPVENPTKGNVSTVVTENGLEATVYEVLSNGQLAGRAVKAVSKKGFGGKITVMFGFSLEGDILGYKVLDCSQETPGLGAKMPEWFQKDGKGNVIGMNPEHNNITVKKDNGEVDAITAATISSRAFCDAIKQAWSAISGASVADAQPCCEDAKPCCEKAEGECCGKCEGEAACEHPCQEAVDSCCHKCPNETVTE